MARRTTFKHVFVQHVPEQLEEGVLYVSTEYATVAHKCYCGCGSEVITPLSPTDWRLTFDGESITLYPSIGNWSFACRSHYWIERGKVIPARQWSEYEIAAGRENDAFAKQAHYGQEAKRDTSPRTPKRPAKASTKRSRRD